MRNHILEKSKKPTSIYGWEHVTYSVDFKSTYSNEDLDYLVGKSIAVLDHLERKKDKDNNSH